MINDIRIPIGGWNRNTPEKSRRALNRYIVNVQRDFIIRGSRDLIPKLKTRMTEQLDGILNDVQRGLYTLKSCKAFTKADTELDLGTHEDLWSEAIEEAFGGAASAVVSTVSDSANYVKSGVFDKVGVALGRDFSDATTNRRLLLRHQEYLVKSKIKNIDRTTKRILLRKIAKHVEDGETVYQVIERIRAAYPSIAWNRVATIVRTEMGRASDEGTKLAMLESGSFLTSPSWVARP